ncbi:MAG: hypothetical protein K1X86_11860 [Ignavibacteria bacterium]|nr:hypothetical protein [Ignavibacteria bacterium]
MTEKILNIEIFFANDLYFLSNKKKNYYFMIYNHYSYYSILGQRNIDSIQYTRINSPGYKTKIGEFTTFFDRIELENNNASIFESIVPLSDSKVSNEFYFVFKTSFDAILIKSDLKRFIESKHILKGIKVLIPFQRYLPLIPMSDNEIEKSNLIKRKPIKLCIDN